MISQNISRFTDTPVQELETLIQGAFYNQVFRLALDNSMEQGGDLQVQAGLFNTLTPYLFNSGYLLQRQVYMNIAENELPKYMNTSSMTEKKDSELHYSGNDLVKKPDNMDPMNEWNSITTTDSESGFENIEAEENNSQNEEIKIYEESYSDQTPTAKKKIKKFHDAVMFSQYTQWLLGQTQLTESTFQTKKVKKKKSKIHISAQRSITPSDEIASESLAQILHKQGHYLEAKKMYKKLSIKFPENQERYQTEIEKLNQQIQENAG
jgi:hypothetical protein